MQQLFTAENGIAFLTLTVLEIVLGIDNIVFISILADKLPEKQEPSARRSGLALAMVTRILLLLSLSWVARLDYSLFTLFGLEISGRDLILVAGGLFLLAKSTHEIHDKLEGKTDTAKSRAPATFVGVVIQIGLLDIIFSLDSVITAIGMANQLVIMIVAVIIAVIIMMFASGPISRFVNQHPTVKILALSFLLLIGMSLIVESLHQHIPKGYIYFAMGFSVFVEMLNLRVRSQQGEPVKLHQAYVAVEAPAQARTKRKTKK